MAMVVDIIKSYTKKTGQITNVMNFKQISKAGETSQM